MVYQAPILEVTGLSKQFGGLKAVDGVSWSIQPGEIVALIGPNGAGKTTVFNLLTGFIKPDHGTVVFEGEDITGQPAHTFASSGLVRSFQTAKMFPSMTVAEIVTTAGLLHGSPRTMRAQTDEILERLNLSDKRNTNASELSLPDRQMVELAKCLAAKPKFVLLDEIMGGLNRAECHVPIEAISQLRESGITFLLVEHVMPIVMTLADRIVVLDFGKKIAEGTPTEIANHPEVQRSYLGQAV
ncbi:MAG: ABC transporter ATP-binding protein [Kineosporiaceae bacterium]|nr:ABC transporter ATP-binding protein [Aeromicrobium sp.]